MSKRPLTELEAQPAAKRTDVGGQHTLAEEYNAANEYITSTLQAALIKRGLSDPLKEDTLITALSTILYCAPPEACLKDPALAEINVKESIMANPDLKQALQSAIVQRRYEDVMSLPILRKQVEYDNPDHPQSRGGVTYLAHPDVGAVFKAFTTPYVADFPEALLEIVDYYHTLKAYNNAISIIQSSGTGKSRGVAEVAQKRFSFLFNLRRDVKQFTYPPPDVSVRDYFLGSATIEGIRRRYTAFLCALFIGGKKWLSNVNRDGVPLAQWWYMHLNARATECKPDPNRSKFYEEVVEDAKKLYEGKDDLTASLRSSCREFVALLHSEYQLDDPSAESPEVACILVFDEAQELADLPKKDDSEERSYFHHLGTVLKGIVESDVFSAFLSTNSNVRSLAPPVQLHPSLRQVTAPSLLHPPITELPFDVFAKDLNGKLRTTGKSTLNAISSVDVMAHFGRPLWYTLHENKYLEVIPLAMAKLNPTQHFPTDELGQFACLAIRIGLQFDASREVGRMNEIKLVESYMRVVFTVPEHREYMRTGTPSEPILAEAAARLLNDYTNKLPLGILAPNVLNHALQRGFLARGERGEMVARLLWTLAHDQVLRTKKSIEVKFHKPILVLDFLRCLFHKDHWNAVLDARPVGDENGPTLSQAFQNAYIHFSHFIDGVNHKIELQKVYRLLLRGAALSCQRNQRSIDFLTPILFGDPDSTTLSRSNTSVLQAQVKNRNADKNVVVDPSLVQSDHPVISLVHELGLPGNSVNHTGSSGEHQIELHAHHYQIVSVGCSSKTFGVILEGVNDIYPMLLGSNLLMEDFPRSDMEKSVSLFRQLEPCTGLEQGQKCLWFGEDVE